MSIKPLLLFLSILMAFSFSALAQTPSSTTATTSAADSTASIAGKWTGTYAGAASGKLELNVKQDPGKPLAGQLAVLGDDGSRYATDLKTVALNNGKFSASYLDAEGSVVTLSGTYRAGKLDGNWEAGQVAGTWQASQAPR